jgi:hypothetical protein
MLDQVSLHCFATANPPATGFSARDKEAVAETPWFSVVQVYSLGAFVANKLELALWREFRASLHCDNGAKRSLTTKTSPGAVPLATFPGAMGLMPGGHHGFASAVKTKSAGMGWRA